MAKKSKQWALNPDEVMWGFHGSSSGKKGQLSRRLKVTACKVHLVHKPTGIKVEGEISSGHYSKKEMQKKRKEMKEALFVVLEKKVVAELNIKGRSD